MKHRKNRLVVEFTTNEPLTEKAAARGLALLLERIDLDAKPIWAVGDVYGDKLVVKQFSRVVRARR